MRWVTRKVERVLQRALPREHGLRGKAHPGDHGQAAVLQLLHTQPLERRRLRGEPERVEPDGACKVAQGVSPWSFLQGQVGFLSAHRRHPKRC